jgi:hypothetical protein
LRLALHWRRASYALGLLFALGGLIAACGGSSGGGSDEDYVRTMCESGDILEEALGSMLAAAFSGDEDEAADAMADAFEEWVDAIDDANPPEDVAETHEAMVNGLRDALDQLRDGETSLEEFDALDNIPEPPQAVQDRLQTVAEGVPECDGAEFFS